MTSTVGSRPGPYQILAPLESGGMGELHRTRDTNLELDALRSCAAPSHSSGARDLGLRP
jgi:hypothetical protein